jgi:xylan 1,4-beta-xylosidase
VAEGGTGYEHAVTMLRSRDIRGPYELHPDVHVITSKDAPDAPLPRAGHGQMVEMPDGSVYHTHLCSRPLPGIQRSPMGRETALQRCTWGDDGWLRLDDGGPVPKVEVRAPSPDTVRRARGPVRRRFDGDTLPIEFQWLRTPHPERIFALTGSALRLTGRESIGSWFEQALVARRQEDHSYRAETEVRFAPTTFQQAAGLTTYYNRHKFHLLAVTFDERLGRVLTILSCPGDWPGEKLSFPMDPIPLPGDGPVRLAVEVLGAEQRFYVKVGEDWIQAGPVLDAGVISDEGGRGEHSSFTGAFVGMAAFDVSGAAATADFTLFDYAPL